MNLNAVYVPWFLAFTMLAITGWNAGTIALIVVAVVSFLITTADQNTRR